MAKSKFSLTLSPTFKANVNIPVPGAGTTPVEFTFKARTRAEFDAFTDGVAGRNDVDVLMDIVSGWELEEPFDREHVEILCSNFMGASRAAIETYLAELVQARLGN